MRSGMDESHTRPGTGSHILPDTPTHRLSGRLYHMRPGRTSHMHPDMDESHTHPGTGSHILLDTPRSRIRFHNWSHTLTGIPPHRYPDIATHMRIDKPPRTQSHRVLIHIPPDRVLTHNRSHTWSGIPLICKRSGRMNRMCPGMDPYSHTDKHFHIPIDNPLGIPLRSWCYTS